MSVLSETHIWCKDSQGRETEVRLSESVSLHSGLFSALSVYLQIYLPTDFIILFLLIIWTSSLCVDISHFHFSLISVTLEVYSSGESVSIMYLGSGHRSLTLSSGWTWTCGFPASASPVLSVVMGMAWSADLSVDVLNRECPAEPALGRRVSREWESSDQNQAMGVFVY